MKHKGTLNQLLSFLIRRRVGIQKVVLTAVDTDGEQYTIYLNEDAQILWYPESKGKTIRFSGRNQKSIEQKLGKYFDPDHPSFTKFLTLYWEPILGIGIGILGLGIGVGGIITSIILVR